MSDDTNTIATQLAELVATLERRGTDTAEGLAELVNSGTHHVAGSNYAGITLADAGKAIRNVAATHQYAVDLDTAQDRYREGPCVAAAGSTT